MSENVKNIISTAPLVDIVAGKYLHLALLLTTRRRDTIALGVVILHAS
jgi:hypothetical protein